ncbi:MAG: small-conductance mechanosensitive channel, partial [Bacteroidia bacterium]
MSKWSETVDKVGSILKKSIITFGENTIHVYDVFIAISILVGAYLIVRWVSRLLEAGQKSSKLTIGQKYAYQQVAKYVIIAIAIFSILKTFNLDLGSLVFGASAVLIALALGLQHLFNDLVSGFFLLFEGTIRVGDIIEVEGMVCRVQEIGIRTSKVKKRDGISVVIPNGKIISNSVINWTTDSSITRFTVQVGVAYGSDVQLVRDVLLECAERHKEVVRSPKPNCRFINFGDSSLEFELL